MKLHLIMQPKGGAGKTFAALHLIQFIKSKGGTVTSFDLDSANNTLSQFKALEAVTADVSHDDNPRRIDARKFDGLLGSILAAPSENVVVDIGASIVGDLVSHLDELDFFKMVDDLPIEEALIHVPISGGQGFVDTLSGLKKMHEFIGDAAKYVIWSNPYFGELEIDGTKLEETKLLRAISSDILGIVTIPNWDSDTKRDDVKQMVTTKLTYDEIAASDNFSIFTKSRLKKIQEDFFARLDLAGLVAKDSKNLKSKK